MGSGASSNSKKQIQNSHSVTTRDGLFEPGHVVVNDHKSLLPSGYRLTKTIGEGSYGKVKQAYSAKHCKDVAVKIIDCRKKNKLYHARFFRREQQVSYVANHHNIVKCLEILECGYKMYFILEYMDNGNLFRYIIPSVII